MSFKTIVRNNTVTVQIPNNKDKIILCQRVFIFDNFEDLERFKAFCMKQNWQWQISETRIHDLGSALGEAFDVAQRPL